MFGISIDGYASLVVSAFILFTGYKAIKETIDLLLGMKPDPEFINDIEAETKKYEIISGIHDIMVHDYGPGRKIVSFHAEVPANGDICKVHDIIDQMEQDLYEKFNCITTIHMDPIVVDNEEINEMREFTKEIVNELNSEFSIHDFRMTDGGKRINLIFDLVVPRDKEYDKEEIVKNNPEKKKKCQNSSGQYKQFGCFLHKYGNLLQCWCFSCWFSGFLLMFLGLISEYKYIIFWEFLEFFSIVEKE